MPVVIDLTGKRFGRLTVIGLSPRSRPHETRWSCRCDCGGAADTRTRSLRIGKTKSCGCIQREYARSGASKRTHGESKKAPEYYVWLSVRSRCQNPNNQDFAIYGGRGVSVCARWDSYENFLADMGRRPSAKHQIDRIDTDGDYGPENCRWATALENVRNRSSSIYVLTEFGAYPVREWGEMMGLSYDAARARVHRGKVPVARPFSRRAA
jgi:hypothetical protein